MAGVEGDFSGRVVRDLKEMKEPAMGISGGTDCWAEGPA